MIKYNPDYLTNENASPDQEVSYQVGFDQAVQVNTYASDIYKHDIGRDVDEITDLAEKLNKAEELSEKLSGMLKEPNKYPDASGNLAAEADAAKKAVTFLKDELQKRFSNYITKSQGYMDNANTELPKVGNRSKRITLAENRLAEQQVTFKTLQSENEDVDATEAAVQLSSASVSYEAALMATGKMIQTTLLNYL
jgi:flagellar hook-associated protein 3 FlgL